MSATEKASVVNQYFAASICSLLALMYGQSVGWSSSAVPEIQEGRGPGGEVLSAAKAGWIGGAFCLGALFSAPFHGLLADCKGRKVAGYIVGLCFTIQWVLMLCAPNFWWILVARAFGGAGGSGSITVATIYANEIAQSKLRSALGGIMAFLYTCGIFSAYALSPLLSLDNISIVYLCITLIYFPIWWKMPESPAYLTLKRQNKEALKAAQWLMKVNETEAAKFIEMIRIEQAGAAKPVSIKELFCNKASRKGLGIGSFLVFVQTFCGIFACHSYAVDIFSKAGGTLSPHTSTLIYGASMLVGALVPPLVADRAPRRVLLGISSALLGLGMGALSFHQWATSQGLIPENAAFLKVLPAIILPFNVFVYYIGFGSVVYIVYAEVFTDEARGIGNGFISVVIWTTSYFLLQFFGISAETFGDFAVFGFFAVICVFGFLFVIFLLPETRGKTTLEIVAILTNEKMK